MNRMPHREKTLTRTRSHLHIETKGNDRFLANTSPIDVKHLVYSTGCTHFDYVEEGDVVVTRRPRYRIEDLPSGCSVTLEKIDSHEDGFPWFQVDEVEWADGLKEGSEPILSMSQLLIGLASLGRNTERLRIRAEMVPVTRRLDFQPVFVGAEDGYSIPSGGRREDV